MSFIVIEGLDGSGKSTQLKLLKNYLETNFKGATAIVVGTEATGLSTDWLDTSTQNMIIWNVSSNLTPALVICLTKHFFKTWRHMETTHTLVHLSSTSNVLDL